MGHQVENGLVLLLTSLTLLKQKKSLLYDAVCLFLLILVVALYKTSPRLIYHFRPSECSTSLALLLVPNVLFATALIVPVTHQGFFSFLGWIFVAFGTLGLSLLNRLDKSYLSDEVEIPRVPCYYLGLLILAIKFVTLYSPNGPIDCHFCRDLWLDGFFGILTFSGCVCAIFQYFSENFSIAETIFVSEIIAMLNMLLLALIAMKLGLRSSYFPGSENLYLDVIAVLHVALLSGMLLIGIINYCFAGDDRKKEYRNDKKILGKLVIIVIAIVFLIIDPFVYWLSNEEAFLATFYFLYTQFKMALLLYFVLVLVVTLAILEGAMQIEGSVVKVLPLIVIRKYFHLVSIAIFVPGLLFEFEFMSLAFAVATSLFLLLEIVRLLNVEPISSTIHAYFSKYTDDRDAGPLILTHIYLLVGCALPVWLTYLLKDVLEMDTFVIWLLPYSGVICLGVGDTMASIVGTYYGKTRWHQKTKKTLEGTSAAILSQMVFCFLLWLLHCHSTTDAASSSFVSHLESFPVTNVLFAVVFTSLLEAFTDQIDNIVLPCAFYTALLVV